MIISGIYTITNISDNKIYVGSSIDIFDRFKQHKKNLLYKKHHNKKLQYDYNKLGEVCFSYEIIEEQPPHLMRCIESYWINILNSTNSKYGYNCYSVWKDHGTSKKDAIVVLTKEGYYVGDFVNCGEASRELGITAISCNQCKKGYISSTKGLVIRSLEDYKENGFEKRSPRYNKVIQNTSNFQNGNDVKVTISKSFSDHMTNLHGEFSEFYELIGQKGI